MNFKESVRKLLFGLTVPQQYVCLERETFSQPLETIVTVEGGVKPVPIEPVFVGYKPVVMAFNDPHDFLGHSKVCLHLYHGVFNVNVNWRGLSADRDSVARMVLEPVSTSFQKMESSKLYVGKAGSHSFLTPFHQFTNSLKEMAKPPMAGNVNLPGNLHDMVRIAYATPRTIALITVEDGGLMNMFPTDLHGKLHSKFYISSLRIGGKAQQQVERVRRLVLAEMPCESFRDVYALGKNHMREMLSRNNFHLSPIVSEKFNFAIPAKALRYFELEVVEFKDIGIHRIYLYKIENEVTLSAGKTLAHIHQYYAQWRKNNCLETDYLFR